MKLSRTQMQNIDCSINLETHTNDFELPYPVTRSRAHRDWSKVMRQPILHKHWVGEVKVCMKGSLNLKISSGG